MFPAAHLPTVRRLERAHRAAMARELRADDIAEALRLAAASDRASRRLAAARNGITIEPPRTRRNLAIGAMSALAAIGRVIARALTRAASLRRASLAAAAKRTARKVAAAARAALRRVGRVVAVALASAPAVAAAHPGHPEHDMPAGVAVGGLLVTAAVLAAAASKAWDTIGPRRRAWASITNGDGDPAGGADPERTEAEPDPEPDLLCSFGDERTAAECRARAAHERYMARRVLAERSDEMGQILAAAHRRTADAYDARAAKLDAPDRTVLVGDGDPGDECEHTDEHGQPCNGRPRQWSIPNGSGYVVACDAHADDLVQGAYLDGSIYTLPEPEPERSCPHYGIAGHVHGGPSYDRQPCPCGKPFTR